MFRKILTENRITFETSPPRTRNMNGAVERMIQNLNTRVRSIMIDANILMQLWAELVNIPRRGGFISTSHHCSRGK